MVKLNAPACEGHDMRFSKNARESPQKRQSDCRRLRSGFTVPLCRGHHRQLHQTGNEVAWWKDLRINSLEIARGLREQTHPASAAGSIPMAKLISIFERPPAHKVRLSW